MSDLGIFSFLEWSYPIFLVIGIYFGVQVYFKLDDYWYWRMIRKADEQRRKVSEELRQLPNWNFKPINNEATD